MPLEYNRNLIPRAKQLRKEMTPQEKHLWYDFLSKYPARFQRQKTIDNYIVDFYCFSAKLVIELDGGQHYTEDGVAYDAERTKILESYGLKVIRFANPDIMNRFKSVCEAIDKAVKDCHPSSRRLRTAPSSRGGLGKPPS
ncbi:MAG: endonuclease domain-containing protein [Oscillospiraceae bacterium]|nr:endonuclease domain-containing protein [Oscillospiraceae bacterium]